MLSSALLARANSGLTFRPDENTVLWLPGQDRLYTSTIKDHSDNSNDGAITGATWDKDTAQGTWNLGFDGDDFVDLSAGISDLALSAGTLMFWFWSSDANAGVVFGTGPGNDANNLAYIVLAGANFSGAYADETIYYSITSGGAEKLRMVLRLGTGAYNDGVKRHIAIRVDGADNAILVNGAKQSITFGVGSGTTANFFFNPAGSTDEAFIGKRSFSAGPSHLTGNVALLSLSSAGLSDSVIKGRYDQEKHLFGVE